MELTVVLLYLSLQVFSTKGLKIPITSVTSVIPNSSRLLESASSLKSLPKVNTYNNIPILHTVTDPPSPYSKNLCQEKKTGTGEPSISTDIVTEPPHFNIPLISTNLAITSNFKTTQPSSLNLDLKCLQEVTVPYNINPYFSSNELTVKNIDTPVENQVTPIKPPLVSLRDPSARNPLINNVSDEFITKDSIFTSTSKPLSLLPSSSTQLPIVFISGQSHNPLDTSPLNGHLTTACYITNPSIANINLSSFTSQNPPLGYKTNEATNKPLSYTSSQTNSPRSLGLTTKSQNDINSSLLTKNLEFIDTSLPSTYYYALPSSSLPIVSLPYSENHFKSSPEVNRMPCLSSQVTPSSVISSSSTNMPSIIFNSCNSMPLPNTLSCNTGPSTLKQPFHARAQLQKFSPFNQISKQNITDIKISSPSTTSIVKPLTKNVLTNMKVIPNSLRPTNTAPSSSFNILQETNNKCASSPPFVPYESPVSLSTTTLLDPYKNHINVPEDMQFVPKNTKFPINTIIELPAFTAPRTKINLGPLAPKPAVTASSISSESYDLVLNVCPNIPSFDSSFNIPPTTFNKPFISLDSTVLSNPTPTNIPLTTLPLPSVQLSLSGISSNHNLAQGQSLQYPPTVSALSKESLKPALPIGTEPLTKMFCTFTTYNNKPIVPSQSNLTSLIAARNNDHLLNSRHLGSPPSGLQDIPPMTVKNTLPTDKNFHTSHKLPIPVLNSPLSTPPVLAPFIPPTFNPLKVPPTSDVSSMTVPYVISNSQLASPNVLPKVESFPNFCQHPDYLSLPQISVPTTPQNTLSQITPKPHSSLETIHLLPATFLSQDSPSLPLSNSWSLPYKGLSLSTPNNLPDVSKSHYYPNSIQQSNAFSRKCPINAYNSMSQYISLQKPVNNLLSNISTHTLPTLGNSYQADTTFHCPVVPLQLPAVVSKNSILAPLCGSSSATSCPPSQILYSTAIPVPYFSDVCTNSLNYRCPSLTLDSAICTLDKPKIIPTISDNPLSSLATPQSNKSQYEFSNTQKGSKMCDLDMKSPLQTSDVKPHVSNTFVPHPIAPLHGYYKAPISTVHFSGSSPVDPPVEISSRKCDPCVPLSFSHLSSVPKPITTSPMSISTNKTIPNTLSYKRFNHSSSPSSNSAIYSSIHSNTINTFMGINYNLPIVTPYYNTVDSHSKTRSSGTENILPLLPRSPPTTRPIAPFIPDINTPKIYPPKTIPRQSPITYINTYSKPSPITSSITNSLNDLTSFLTKSILTSVLSRCTRQTTPTKLPNVNTSRTNILNSRVKSASLDAIYLPFVSLSNPNQIKPAVDSSLNKLPIQEPYVEPLHLASPPLLSFPLSPPLNKYTGEVTAPPAISVASYSLPIKEPTLKPFHLPMTSSSLPSIVQLLTNLINCSLPSCSESSVLLPNTLHSLNSSSPIVKDLLFRDSSIIPSSISTLPKTIPPLNVSLTTQSFHSPNQLSSVPYTFLTNELFTDTENKSPNLENTSGPTLFISSTSPPVELTQNLPETRKTNLPPSISHLNTLNNTILSKLLNSKMNKYTESDKSINIDRQQQTQKLSSTDSKNTQVDLPETALSSIETPHNALHLLNDFIPLNNNLQPSSSTYVDNVPLNLTSSKFTPSSSLQIFNSSILLSNTETCCNLDIVPSLLPYNELAPMPYDSLYPNIPLLSLKTPTSSSSSVNTDLGTSSSSLNLNSMLDPSNLDKNEIKNVLHLIILSKLVGNNKNCDLLESYLNGNMLRYK